LKISKAHNGGLSALNDGLGWQDYSCRQDIPSNPPNDIVVEVQCDDYMGEYMMKAKRLNYKPGNKGANKWRWVSERGITLDRKETPEKWRHINDA
jgi:hypothetical protein